MAVPFAPSTSIKSPTSLELHHGEDLMRIRQTKIRGTAPTLYWIDVQTDDGIWHEIQIPHPLNRVRNFRRFMMKENSR